ncbi:hypothetical protein [Peribacillus butanolivorans]
MKERGWLLEEGFQQGINTMYQMLPTSTYEVYSMKLGIVER